MSRISRLVVLATALASLCGTLSSTAGAVTWTNDGATSFTATGNPGTWSSTGVSTSCLGADVSGTAPASSTATTYLVSGTVILTSCVFAGSPSSIHCNYTWTATTVVQPIVTGNVDWTCGIYISNTKLCHLHGVDHVVYTNEAATWTFTTSIWRTTGANCPYGSNDSLHVPHMHFRITSANPPTITRAA